MRFLKQFLAWLKSKVSSSAPQQPSPPAVSNSTPSAAPAVSSAPTAPSTSQPVLNKLPTGVSVVDKVNGLVAFDASINPNLAGQAFCVMPALDQFDKGSQAQATIIFNTAMAKGAEQNGLGLWIRVSKVVPNVGGAAFAPFQLPVPPDWLPNAWSVGSQHSTWDAVLAVVKIWHAPVEIKA